MTECRTETASLTKTAVLLALALVFQIGLASLAQPVVGPLVNMVLILAVLKVSPAAAIMIGCMTPLAAYMLGIMPLFPVLPVIMAGNAVYILLFSAFYKYNQWLAVFSAAIAKFFLMAMLIRLMAFTIFSGIPGPLITALSLPQFYTALIGGSVAILVNRCLPRKPVTD
ncbi:MAG: ECF transporter S component [Tindallia sp. MSAO_Bac2]|nr:MAG: ECF transporter S component [Tindallia sp. MSAO_Bac2]